MQILFMLSFGLVIVTAMFIGNALSGGYIPYASFAAAFLFFISLFIPFLSEYNVLHRGFSRIGDNFMDMIRSKQKEPEKGEVEIFAPNQSMQTKRAPSPLDKNATMAPFMVVLVGLSAALVGYDALEFYILGDGLKDDSLPISNF